MEGSENTKYKLAEAVKQNMLMHVVRATKGYKYRGDRCGFTFDEVIVYNSDNKQSNLFFIK